MGREKAGRQSSPRREVREVLDELCYSMREVRWWYSMRALLNGRYYMPSIDPQRGTDSRLTIPSCISLFPSPIPVGRDLSLPYPKGGFVREQFSTLSGKELFYVLFKFNMPGRWRFTIVNTQEREPTTPGSLHGEAAYRVWIYTSIMQ